MNPRYGLPVGAAIAAGVGLFLTIAPTSWLEELLDVRGADTTSFLVRRYAASATAALFVITTAIVRRTNPQRAALLGFATWFGVQGVVAILGVGTGTVGGLAWLAVFADPLIAVWFLMWSSRVVNSPHRTRGRMGRLIRGCDAGWALVPCQATFALFQRSARSGDMITTHQRDRPRRRHQARARRAHYQRREQQVLEY